MKQSPGESVMVDVQRTAQLAVLRSIDWTGYVAHAAIDMDRRDVDRAVELLLRDGAIVIDPSRAVKRSDLPMRLTDVGRQRLRVEQ